MWKKYFKYQYFSAIKDMVIATSKRKQGVYLLGKKRVLLDMAKIFLKQSVCCNYLIYLTQDFARYMAARIQHVSFLNLIGYRKKKTEIFSLN